MAKWGEGDPRWIVEVRPDGINVNNWHWVEKDASTWSQNKLATLLVGLKTVNSLGTCETVEMTNCTGEASVNNRKSKLIIFYEWNIKVKWKVTWANSNIPSSRGSIKISQFSQEYNINDVVLADKYDVDSDMECKALIKQMGQIIKRQLVVYLECLRTTFSEDLFLKTKETVGSAKTIPPKPEFQNKLLDTSFERDSKSKIDEFDELKTTEMFKCTTSEFYNALTVKEMVERFTGETCVLNPEEGGTFELFKSYIKGTFVKLIPSELIELKWRMKPWPEGHFSDVTIKIKDLSDSIEVQVHQKGIPYSELEITKDGWQRYYWNSIRRVFGFGTFLFDNTFNYF